MNIPFIDLNREYEFFKTEIDDAILECLYAQKWIGGEKVNSFESEVAKYIGVNYAVGVASGTDALVIALRAMALKTKGRPYFTVKDEIITTPFTFIATGEAILRAGATPVFVDIEHDTLNIDSRRVSEKINDYTVGILPVHLFGRTCNMELLIDLAAKHGLFIVEDGAQAFGARYKHSKVGALGNAGAFSFFPTKNLGCYGDGGMITTNHLEVAEIARSLRQHGKKHKYQMSEITGYNSRLDAIQAAILSVKIKHIEKFNLSRKNQADTYRSELSDIVRLLMPIKEETPGEHVYNQFTINVMHGDRDKLKSYLCNQHSIETKIYYQNPLFKSLNLDARNTHFWTCSNTCNATREVLSLPIRPFLKPDEINKIIDSIKRFYKET